jgi:hypothetical protein
MLGSERLSRKRLRSELPQPNSPSHPTSKRQKFTSEPPASFWDNLSKFWLTKRALKELDRRNTEAAAKPSRTPYLQRVCQRRATQYPAADYIRACEPRILRDIQQFARQGGPDLSDIRNVRITS